MTNRKLILTTGILILIAAVCALIAGCTAFRNGAPPTAFERSLYDVRTNYTPTVVVQTNVIPVTTYQTNTVTVNVTNPVGVVEWHTNIAVVPVTQYQTNIASVTNQTPNYYYAPNSRLTGAEGAVSAIPIYGTLASTALAGLAALWGWVRSSKNGAAGATLAQSIETMREFIKQLPNGAVYDSALVQWLQQHQADTGTLTTVLNIIDQSVKNPDAQIAAQQVRAAIAALNPAALPPQSTPAKV